MSYDPAKLPEGFFPVCWGCQFCAHGTKPTTQCKHPINFGKIDIVSGTRNYLFDAPDMRVFDQCGPKGKLFTPGTLARSVMVTDGKTVQWVPGPNADTDTPSQTAQQRRPAATTQSLSDLGLE